MKYTITSDTVGLAIGPMSETANDVQEALNKHVKCGMMDLPIEDQVGHKIDGDELLDCLTGKRRITEDLQAV